MSYPCPYCNKVMYPNDEGDCPYCFKSLKRQSTPEPKEILVKHRQQLPQICFHCGRQAEKYLKIKCSKSSVSMGPIAGMIASIIFPIILLVQDQGRYEKVEARIPICCQCKKEKRKIDPEWVDYDEHILAFIVHDNLKSEFKKIKRYESYCK